MAVISGPNISIELRNENDDLVKRFSNNTEAGSTLSLEWTEIKNGGVDEMIIRVSKNTELLYYTGMSFYVFKDGVLLASSYIQSLPEEDSSDPIKELVCAGWFHRLETIDITDTYTAQTGEAILLDLETEFNSLGILIDAADITIPTNSLTFDFEKSSLLDIVTDILATANYDITDTEYRYWIDSERNFHMEAISTTEVLFEGWDYQNPEVELDDGSIVNKLYIYRVDESTSTSLLATIQDTDSQARYGIRKDDLMVPYSSNVATATYIGQAKIEYLKNAKKMIHLSNIEDKIFDFIFYGLNNKPTNRWGVLASCDTTEGWTLPTTSNVTYSLSAVKVLTGNLSLKVDLNDNTTDEAFYFTVDPSKYTVKAIEFSLYFVTMVGMVVNVYRPDGTYETLNFSVLTENLDIYNGSTESELDINDGVTTSKLSITTALNVSEGWYTFRIEQSLFAISKVEFVIKEDSLADFYLDNINILAESYSYSHLPLEKVKYVSKGRKLFSEADFGGTPPSLIDEIEESDFPNAQLYKSFTR